MRHIVKEMGLTREEFYRTLPAALAGLPYEVSGDTVTVGEGARTVELILAREQERRLGALRLPTTTVELHFHGYGQDEMDAFVARFDLSFRRGGG